MTEPKGIYIRPIIYLLSKENDKLLAVVPCASTLKTGEASKETKGQKAPSGAEDKAVEKVEKRAKRIAPQLLIGG